MIQDAHPKQYRCILWGGYAWGNVGDELTLAVALQDMKAIYGDSVAVLTRSPGYTRRLFPDCNTISYEPVRPADPAKDYDIGEQLSSTCWAKQVAACETLYLVGGGYLSDLFFVNWTLLPVFVAHSSGVKIATAPLGLGPFSSSWWVKRVADVFQSAKVVVRDDASVEFCRQHDLAVERREDDGFRLAEVFPMVRLHKTRKPIAKRIGINVFCQQGSTGSKDTKAWWTALLENLSGQNTIIEGFCFHNSYFDDFSVTSECFHRAGLDPNDVRVPDFDFRVACARLAEFDAIICSRFHAIVVGNTIGIPTFAVCDGEYYGRKMEAATKNFELSALVRQLESSPRDTAANVLNAINSPAIVGGTQLDGALCRRR